MERPNNILRKTEPPPFSLSANRLAGISEGEILSLFNITSGETIATQDCSLVTVWALDFPDEKTLASGHENGMIQLWDSDSGETKMTLTAHGDVVTTINFSLTGGRMCSTSLNGSIVLWDLTSGATVLPPQPFEGHPTSIALSPDGRRVVVGSFAGDVYLWDFNDAKVTVAQLKGHTGGGVWAIALSPLGRAVAKSSRSLAECWCLLPSPLSSSGNVLGVF